MTRLDIFECDHEGERHGNINEMRAFDVLMKYSEFHISERTYHLCLDCLMDRELAPADAEVIAYGAAKDDGSWTIVKGKRTFYPEDDDKRVAHDEWINRTEFDEASDELAEVLEELIPT